MPVSAMSASGNQVLGVLLGGLVLWLFVDTTWPSLVILFGLMLVPEMGVHYVTEGSLGLDTIFFLMAVFMISASLKETGIARRIAVWFVTCKLAKKGVWWSVGMIFFACLFLGSFLSTDGTMLIFFPILQEIFDLMGAKREESKKFPAMMILSILFISLISHATSPISHAITIIAMGAYGGFAGTELGFVEYSAVAFPTCIVMVALWFVACRVIIRPDMSDFAKIDTDALNKEMHPMTIQEKIAGIVYLLTVVFWVLPGVAAYIFPENIATMLESINRIYPPVIGVIILHLWTVDGKPVMDYRVGFSSVFWNALLFMAAVMCTAGALSLPEVAINKWIIDCLNPILSGMSPVVFIIIIAAGTVLVTNFLPNVLAAVVMMAVAMPITMTVYSGQIPAALVGTMIIIACNCSFATPTATASIAIATETGWAPLSRLFGWGSLLAVISIASILLVGWPLCSMIFPL